MSRAAILLALGVSAAAGGAATYEPAFVEPMAVTDLVFIDIRPHGTCADDAGTRECYRTSTLLKPRAVNAAFDLAPIPHDSPTRPETVPAIQAMVELVAIPTFVRRNGPRLAATLDGQRIYPDVSIAHATNARIANGHYLVDFVVPPLLPGFPPLVDFVTDDAPPTVLDSVNAMAVGYLLPALREQTGLR